MELLTDVFLCESTSVVGGQSNIIDSLHDYSANGDSAKSLAMVRQILWQRSARSIKAAWCYLSRDPVPSSVLYDSMHDSCLAFCFLAHRGGIMNLEWLKVRLESLATSAAALEHGDRQPSRSGLSTLAPQNRLGGVAD